MAKSATASILRRNAAAPSRRVEVFIERIEAHLATLPTYEEREAYLTEVVTFMESRLSGQ